MGGIFGGSPCISGSDLIYIIHALQGYNCKPSVMKVDKCANKKMEKMRLIAKVDIIITKLITEQKH